MFGGDESLRAGPEQRRSSRLTTNIFTLLHYYSSQIESKEKIKVVCYESPYRDDGGSVHDEVCYKTSVENEKNHAELH